VVTDVLTYFELHPARGRDTLASEQFSDEGALACSPLAGHLIKAQKI